MLNLFIMRRFIYYFLSWTWGIIMSFIGLIAILLPFGERHIFHGRIYKIYGEGWGGVSLGCFFICSKDCQEDSLMGHECGHGLQNIIWGPLFPFIIALPSVVRYWYLEKKYYSKGVYYDYDNIWFERQATNWGEKYILTDLW